MSNVINRRTFLSGSLLALCLPSNLVASLVADRKVVLRFAALSDVHFDRSHNEQSPERQRLRKALRAMNRFSRAQSYGNFDALLVAGDFSNHGVIEEIGPFKAVLDAELDETTQRVLCMGNHEFYGGNRELWEKTFETSANRRREINGYQFITISPQKGTCNENDYVYLLDWLEENLKAATEADPSKPVFVVQHYHVRDTVYGSEDKPGDFHAGVRDLTELLAKYPQVFHISGHSHIPSYDPRAVWQGDFTCVGTGSLSYFAMLLYERERNFQMCENANYRDAGTFLIFEIYDDGSIRVRLYDVLTDSFWNREYLFVDPVNRNSFVYTNERFNVAKLPRWRDDSSINTIEIAPNAASIEFTQAEDEFCVVSYRLEVEKASNDSWEPFKTFYAWSDYFMMEPKERLIFNLLELVPSSKFRVKIYATGAFQKETETPLVLEFETPNVSNERRDEPNPRGDFLDVSFDVKQGLIDSTGTPYPLDNYKNVGDVKVVADATLGAVASFDGKTQALVFPFSGIRAGAVKNEISIAVKFKLDLSQKDDSELISIFGSTENGGLGFEYYVKTKELKVRYWLDKGYRFLAVPFDPSRAAFAVFTYDGRQARLYLDGELVASEDVSGAFRFTQTIDARGFCVGGDVCVNWNARFFFPGVIALARVYSFALNEEQVALISK